MTVLYREQDANADALRGSRIAILGYGSLGRPMALNMRDSGLVDILIGNPNDADATQGHRDGFDVVSLTEAARGANVKLLLLPDEAMPEIYIEHVSPSLRPGDTLVFASGYNVAFGFIEPPPFVNVVMLAPRTIGLGVREGYLTGQGFLSFVAVAQDATGKAWDQLLALALAAGSLRAGAVELTFRQEAEIDLFIEQALWPSLLNVVMTAADLLVKEGYPSEAALLDVYVSGELSYMLHKASELGLQKTLGMYPLTSQYGIASRNERFQEPKLRRQMEITLEEIRSGKFAQEWAAEYSKGYPRLEALLRKRSMMSLWNQEQQAIDMLHPHDT